MTLPNSITALLEGCLVAVLLVAAGRNSGKR